MHVIFLFCLLTTFALPQSGSTLSEANLLLLNGEDEAAITKLENYVKANPEDGEAHFLLGATRMRLMQYDLAKSALENAARFDSTNLQTQFSLASAYDHLGYEKEAEQLFQKLYRQPAMKRQAAISLGKLFMNQKRYQNALPVYVYLTGLDKQNSFFFKQRGLCEMHLKMLEAAISSFRQAMALNPQDISNYVHLNNLYSRLEAPDSVASILEKGLVKHPGHPVLLRAKGEMLFKQEAYQKAADVYLQVISAGDSAAMVYKKLGMCYFNSKRYPPAMLALKIAIKKDSLDATMYYYLAVSHKRVENVEKSVQLMEKAIAVATPDYMGEFYLQLGDSYDQTKRYQDAIRAYKKALAYDDQEVLAIFFIATVYDKFYADRNVPLKYYQEFLEKSAALGPKYRDYAEERIQAITEEIHIKKGAGSQ